MEGTRKVQIQAGCRMAGNNQTGKHLDVIRSPKGRERVNGPELNDRPDGEREKESEVS